MKINQVAELVDITKKNIRFYEDQGLVDPGRDPQNGYREYSLDDVRQLERIKLLRQLGISCDNIRKMKDGKLEIEKCMHDRLRELEEEERSIDHMRTMCDLLFPGDRHLFVAGCVLISGQDERAGKGRWKIHEYPNV